MSELTVSSHNLAPQVLVVEDDDAHRQVLEDLLEDEGFSPISCASVEAALSLIGGQGFAAAIVDQRLPGPSGVDLLEILRQRDARLRVIINTGFGSFDSAKRSVNLGAFGYVEKAGDPGELMRLVHRAVRLHIGDALRSTEARLRAIFDHSPTAFALTDVQGRYLMVNRRFEALHEVDAAEVVGRTATDVLPAGLADLVVADAAQVLRSGAPVEQEHHLGADDARTLLVTAFPVFGASGEVEALGSIALDITDRKRAEEELSRSEERYQGLYDHAPDMYLSLSPDGSISSVNEFGAGYLGYDKHDLIGRSLCDIVHPEDQHAVSTQLRSMVVDGAPASELEYRKLRADGSVLWVHQRARLVREARDGAADLRIVCRDITEARVRSDELSYQASHDALTGLVNRRELEKRLARLLETAHSTTSEHALCYLDLDQFKAINDTCGHVAGDELLRQLGAMLPACVRKRDTLARLGGDEFAVLMEHCTLMQARRVANALRSAVEEFRFLWHGKTFAIGVSIGLVPIASGTESVAGVLRAADTACYVAKDQGRNRIHVYHEDDREVARRHGEMQWVARLNEALEADRFVLWAQPIVSLEDERGAPSRHCEVLVRLLDERADEILPGAFLPAAERYDLAVRLDRWVVSKTCEWLACGRAEMVGLDLCSVNLSAQSMADKDFLDYVLESFARTGLSPARICFEITETSAISNLKSATRFINTLREAGCRFALDDFGSGLSSFAYLKHLPVDYLKIDGMFVRDIIDDPVDLAMVRSIYDVARAMNKATIAEFVDDMAVLERLREIGIDHAQGYAVGRPVPLDRLFDERVPPLTSTGT